MVRFALKSLLPAVAAFGLASTASAAVFTNSYLDGGTWNTVYVQGFSPSVAPSPNPGSAAGDTVFLNNFEFFKSGNADSASNIRLAILNNIFVNMSGGLTTSNAAFVGLSSNTVASTSGLAVGDSIGFTFNNLALTYGSDYAAVFVNVSGNTLTPVLVSALTADYVSGVPESNYGTNSQFVYAVSNFIDANGFFSTFSSAGDANFRATLNTVVPEPTTLGALGVAGMALISRRRR